MSPFCILKCKVPTPGRRETCRSLFFSSLVVATKDKKIWPPKNLRRWILTIMHEYLSNTVSLEVTSSRFIWKMDWWRRHSCKKWRNGSFLATDEGATEKISELQVGMELPPIGCSSPLARSTGFFLTQCPVSTKGCTMWSSLHVIHEGLMERRWMQPWGDEMMVA